MVSRIDALQPAIVLVRPSEQGNVGATARAMANLGLERLLVVEPAPPFGDTARAFATGGVGILERAERYPSLDQALAGFTRVVATTSDRERSRAVPAVTPRQLAALLGHEPAGTRSAVVFGPERSGLTADELARCHPTVTVPCSLEHPTLNLAQAVVIVAYELQLARAGASGAAAIVDRDATPAAPAPMAPGEAAAARAELEGVLAHATELLHRVGFARHPGFPVVLRDLRHLLARASPTERDLSILRGICRRVEGALERSGGAAAGRVDVPVAGEIDCETPGDGPTHGRSEEA